MADEVVRIEGEGRLKALGGGGVIAAIALREGQVTVNFGIRRARGERILKIPGRPPWIAGLVGDHTEQVQRFGVVGPPL